MNVTELRLNNYINYNGLNILLSNNMFVDLLQGISIDFYKPIELNEDMLLKCGFESSDFHRTHFFKYEKIDNNLRGDIFCFNIDRNTDFYNTNKTKSFTFKPFGLHIKYLHQLQNLYFEITGKELEINL